jgi:hypothetical protein
MSEEIKNEDVASTESAVESTPVVEDKVEEVAVEATPDIAEEVKVEEATVEAVVEAPVEAEKEQEIITNAVKSSKNVNPGKPGLAPVGDGAIGSTFVAPKPVAKKPALKQEAEETVALQSTKNVVWQGVGKVTRGVNVVSKAEAEQWLTRNHITLLTPEQVAKEFNK